MYLKLASNIVYTIEKPNYRMKKKMSKKGREIEERFVKQYLTIKVNMRAEWAPLAPLRSKFL